LGRSYEGLQNWSDAAVTYASGLKQYPDSTLLSVRLLATGRRRSVRRPDWVLHTLPSRQRVLEIWLEARKRDPTNATLTHRIALLSGTTAEKLDVSRDRRVRELWRLAVAGWTFLLDEDDAWQAQFVRQRSAVYGRDATEKEAADFRNQIQSHIENMVTSSRRPQAGEPTLREEFLRERQAARACRLLPAGGPRGDRKECD
jgi:hypothetical protein